MTRTRVPWLSLTSVVVSPTLFWAAWTLPSVFGLLAGVALAVLLAAAALNVLTAIRAERAEMMRSRFLSCPGEATVGFAGAPTQEGEG